MNQFVFNQRLRQTLLLIIIIAIGILLVAQLSSFIPGFLGGITLYILSRSLYMKLVYLKKWKKGWTAVLFILGYLVLISLPIYFSVTLISPKINEVLHKQDKIIAMVQQISNLIQEKTGYELLTGETAKQLAGKMAAILPRLLNSTANIIANIVMMFFLLYFLLVEGRSMEKSISKIIPLQKHNVTALTTETKTMIKANALGIPIISLIQGITSAIGYWIFGVEDWGMWGFVTGVFAFFPIVGTTIIWLPLVIFLYAQGHTWPATGLAIYSLLVTGNVDYLARLSLMKKMGDVHPLVTILGVIVGLSLFGFVGLVFGPLLISYFLVLVKIYMNEFSDTTTPESSDSD
ncbi:MAG: AI-2E family transporter [Chitinophagaceae bacterium]|nr:AI-2E family transporter [Chitinophagaceae bacterium]